MNWININLVNKATVGKMKFEEKFKMVRDGLKLVKSIILKGFDFIRIKQQLCIYSKNVKRKYAE